MSPLTVNEYINLMRYIQENVEQYNEGSAVRDSFELGRKKLDDCFTDQLNPERAIPLWLRVKLAALRDSEQPRRVVLEEDVAWEDMNG